MNDKWNVCDKFSFHIDTTRYFEKLSENDPIKLIKYICSLVTLLFLLPVLLFVDKRHLWWQYYSGIVVWNIKIIYTFSILIPKLYFYRSYFPLRRTIENNIYFSIICSKQLVNIPFALKYPLIFFQDQIILIFNCSF